MLSKDRCRQIADAVHEDKPDWAKRALVEAVADAIHAAMKAADKTGAAKQDSDAFKVLDQVLSCRDFDSGDYFGETVAESLKDWVASVERRISPR